MIKTKDVKIGNLLMFENSIVEVVEINREAFYCEHKKYGLLESSVCGFEGYPISKEMLIDMFNFVESDGKIYLPISDYGYVMEYLDWRGDWVISVEYYDPLLDSQLGELFSFGGLGLKYQHQLSNLLDEIL